MKKLFSIIKKNFRLLVRSRTSALIVFLGPLVLILLVGLAFNNAARAKVNVAVYSPDETELMKSLLGKFEENQYTILSSQTLDECIDNVKYGNAHTCLVFPEDFKISQEKRNELQFFVDYAEINLVYLLIDMISTQVQQESTEITEDLTKRLVNKIEETKLKLAAHRNILLNLNLSEEQTKKELEKTIGSTEMINISIDFSTLSTSSIMGKLSELEDFADDINTLLNKIRLECGSDYCFEQVDEAKNATASLKNELSGTSSNVNTTTLYTSMNRLATSIYALRSKVDDANDKKEGVIMAINQAIEKIEKNKMYIEDLFSGVETMLVNLETLKITNATIIASPITTKIKSVAKESTHFNFLFPLLIVLVIMTTSILFSSTLVMNEKKSKAFFRNFVTPTSEDLQSFGIFFTSLLIILLQVFIFVFVAGYFFKVDIIPNLGITTAILFVVTSLFVLTGMLIGNLFRTSETNTLAAISLTSIFLFFSKTVLPLESMPDFFRNLANYNPLVISTDLLKQSIFFRISNWDILLNMMPLIIYILFIMLIIFVLQKLLKAYVMFHMHRKPGAEAAKEASAGEKIGKLAPLQERIKNRLKHKK